MKISAKSAWLVLAILAGFFLATTPAVCHALTKNEILARMKTRAADLQKYKTAGSVGEVYNGKVEAVKPTEDIAVNNLVRDENADRVLLFGIIAAEQGGSAAAAGEAWGKKAAAAAKRGEYLKGADGKWTQKGD